MINERSNAKIQGVTRGVVAAAEVRVTEGKKSRDWEALKPPKTESLDTEGEGEPLAKWSVSDSLD